MSTREQVKQILAANDALQRQLQAADKAWNEIDAVAGVLSARKNELTETEAWLERTKVAAREATARLDKLSQTVAKEEKRIGARIDRLKAEMLFGLGPARCSCTGSVRSDYLKRFTRALLDRYRKMLVPSR
jgi:chaperonin cofactor prefoldin